MGARTNRSCVPPGWPGVNLFALAFRFLYCRRVQFMNAKLLLKTLLLLVLLLLLVIIGMNNRETVHLRVPPLLSKAQTLPAALMYYGFFAVGVLSGAVLTAGKKGGGGASSRGKGEK